MDPSHRTFNGDRAPVSRPAQEFPLYMSTASQTILSSRFPSHDVPALHHVPLLLPIPPSTVSEVTRKLVRVRPTGFPACDILGGYSDWTAATIRAGIGRTC